MVKEVKFEMEVSREVKFADEKFFPRQRPGQHVREIRACQDFEQGGLRKDHQLDGVLHRLKG